MGGGGDILPTHVTGCKVSIGFAQDALEVWEPV